MKKHLVVVAALVAISGGFLVLPASAATSTVTNVVNDAGTNSPWAGTEVFGASAYDTSSVTGDNANPAGGTLTYQLFAGGSCTGTPISTQPVNLNPDGSVPNSDPTGTLNADTYSYQATYNGDDGFNDPSSGLCASFTIQKATPSPPPTISNLPPSATWLADTGFTASVNGGNSDGATSVTSGSPSVCTASGLTVTYVSAGNCNLDAQTAASTNFVADTGVTQTIQIARATPSPPTISNIPNNAVFSDVNFTASVTGTNSDGTKSVSSGTPAVCTTSGLVVTYVTAGNCTLTAETAQTTDFAAASGGTQTFTIRQVTPTGPTITNIPSNPIWPAGGGFTAQLGNTDGSDGAQSVTSSTPDVCTTIGLAVTFATAGTCTLTGQTAGTTNFVAATGSPQSFTVAQATPAAPTITNKPANGTFGGGFTAAVSTTGDGAPSVTSNTPDVCTASGFTVAFVGVGTCSLSAQVAASVDYAARTGAAQTLTIGRATPTTPTITDIPSPASEFFGFTAIVGTSGDGTTLVTSSTPKVCSVSSNGLTVTFVGFGVCTLTPSVSQGTNFFGATGSPQSFPVQEASHGYWLVGSDGGIFSFGTATFHGSMGGTPLQRPVMAITPTSTGNGYWLVASDGGIFSFGDSTYHGSLPGIGLHPAGSGLPHSLNAPIVGMVPTYTGDGYFMVASDGGVFAFGDAKFEGSCPGIGGCAGTAVAVMPDHTGNGYWLVTNTGGVYAFGDAGYYGGPTPSPVHVVDGVATRDGNGYWLLFSNGVVDNFGDADSFGAPVGYVNAFNPATTIFPTVDNQGYWVASARGDVFSYGDSPFLGSMAAAGLNGEIIGAFGF